MTIRRAAGLGILILPWLVQWSVQGCSTREAAVEEAADGGWRATPYELVSAAGKRDGYVTNAVFTFRDPGHGTLTLQLEISVDPQAKLESGRWTREDGRTTTAGGVVALDVRFLGGQGEGVSAGGKYLLVEGEKERFRVTLPPTGLDGGAGR
jgi:hypothetical protein